MALDLAAAVFADWSDAALEAAAAQLDRVAAAMADRRVPDLAGRRETA